MINRVYRRSYLKRQFLAPVTACLLAIDGEEPIGVKLSYYSVENNTERGAFLTIDTDRWRRKKNPGAVSSKFSPEKLKKLARFKYKTEYDMVSEFNLADVLLRGGFEILLESFREDEDQENSFSLRTGNMQVKW